MSKVKDVILSIVGASAAGVTVFFIDRYLAAKQDAESQPAAPVLGVSADLQAQQFAEGIAGTLQTSAATNSTAVVSATPVPPPSTTPDTPAPPTLAQQIIAASMANLNSLASNNYQNYNVPTQTAPTTGA